MNPRPHPGPMPSRRRFTFLASIVVSVMVVVALFVATGPLNSPSSIPTEQPPPSPPPDSPQDPPPPLPPPPPPPEESPCKESMGAGYALCIETTVTRVIDGDTVEIEGGLKIRLVLVDAPELSDVGGPESWLYLESLCSNTSALVDEDDFQVGDDPYGRILAVVYCDGLNANAAMISSGHASTYYLFCPETDFGSEALTECSSKIAIRPIPMFAYRLRPRTWIVRTFPTRTSWFSLPTLTTLTPTRTVSGARPDDHGCVRKDPRDFAIETMCAGSSSVGSCTRFYMQPLEFATVVIA